MMVASLLDGVAVEDSRGDLGTTEVRGIAFDSRRVEPGWLFCCVPGARSDGHLFADRAVAAGASALLCEHFVDQAVTQVRVPAGTVRQAMAAVSDTFFGHPSRTLQVVGVTGTNGKTSVTQLLRAVADAAGRPTVAIGTLDGERTTPEAPDLQQLLARARDEGKVAAAIEVSSHALDQRRVDATRFAVGVFTNLTRDHLDYHGSMAAYFAAKASLFTADRCGLAVINVDDPWGRTLADQIGERGDGPPVVEVHLPAAVEVSLDGSRFPWRGRTVRLPLVGAFNVENALLAAEAARALGIDEEAIVRALAGVATVPGRMDVLDGGDLHVVVDYAHTPAGLSSALATLRAMVPEGRVICVFGCGGDRDRGKRPLMGAAASAGADLVVLTSDNPRSEDAATIAEEVLAGTRERADVLVELDREAAIRRAVTEARAGDVVLVAGKGHETTQQIGEVTRPFDDSAVARSALAERAAGERPR